MASCFVSFRRFVSFRFVSCFTNTLWGEGGVYVQLCSHHHATIGLLVDQVLNCIDWLPIGTVTSVTQESLSAYRVGDQFIYRDQFYIYVEPLYYMGLFYIPAIMGLF